MRKENRAPPRSKLLGFRANFYMNIPEQGQLVQLRNRYWQVQDVIPHQEVDGLTTLHHLALECLDDDHLGNTLNIIWQREINPAIYSMQELPELQGAWDSDERFQAFLTAIRWSNASLLERETIQAPFHAAIDIEEYQLEPVVRALTMPRANLLIADDVGLGKTIEAGLVMQEMLARRRIRRILIICPASLQRQWQDEMRDKFQLAFEIIDRDTVQRLRREFGVHINPWQSYPRLITSMDFIKREQPMRSFWESLQSPHSSIRDWDLLIVDEAHNLAPSGRQHYAVDSDRTRMLRQLADHFEHRLFLTATPHNGFTESFTSLLELLDPLRFSRGPEVDRFQIQQVMVRRLKEDIKNKLGERKFAEREVLALPVELPPAERHIHGLLDQYTASRLGRLDWAQSMPVRFALTMLKKRLLSSPQAFARSLQTHFNTLGATFEDSPDQRLMDRMVQRVEEDWADDREKAQREEDVLIESTRYFTDLTPQEQGYLQTMAAQAPDPSRPDAKAEALIIWIEAHLQAGGQWNNERLIIFTEYLDTFDYLARVLGERYGTDRLLALIGGMNMTEREAIKQAFQQPPTDHPVRILIATDAASEGLNLQAYCRYLIHYEIPWNPNRMEQRNGRIDRHGQKADVVQIFHFLYREHEDSHFLETVVSKVQTMREDLGTVGNVIAEQVELALLGQRPRTLDVPAKRRELVRDLVRGEVLSDQRRRDIMRHINQTRDALSLYPATMAQVLHEALQLVGHPGLSDASDPLLRGKAFRLQNVPESWRSAAQSLTDSAGRLRDLIFEHGVARNRQDVVLLHLNHPLMKRAIGTFRARLWAEQQHSGIQSLHRVSYRVLPDTHLNSPVVMVYGRLLAINQYSQQLHEDVVLIGGEINAGELDPLTSDVLKRYLEMPYDQPAMPRHLGERLRKLYPQHQRQLLQLLTHTEEQMAAPLHARAAHYAETDAAAIEELIKQRIREIDQRIKNETQDSAPPAQLAMFDRDEYLQYEEDMQWLRRKREDLKERRKVEPGRVRAGYVIKSVRIFPLALQYLIPEGLMGE